jgi:hypothetical protein
MSLEDLPFTTGGFMKGFPEESFPESNTAGGIKKYFITLAAYFLGFLDPCRRFGRRDIDFRRQTPAPTGRRSGVGKKSDVWCLMSGV